MTNTNPNNGVIWSQQCEDCGAAHLDVFMTVCPNCGGVNLRRVSTPDTEGEDGPSAYDAELARDEDRAAARERNYLDAEKDWSR
jgi:hypothetical protein